jgi:threonine aldolase
VAEQRDLKTVWAGCDRALSRFATGDRAGRSSTAAALRALAEWAPEEAEIDRYGTGELASGLENRIARLLGKEAAVWLPSGTMAQQIALRLHADRSGRRGVAFHPQSHVDVHEERGYEALHGLRGVLVGNRNRLIATADLEAVREPFAALLLELPQRDLGGQLPEWDDLVATCEAARSRGAALHLDGARLWQCPPCYGRPLDEIAGLFDTVYVSLYKDLGAPAGCALAGPAEFIEEARVWQVRHGGRMFSVYPFLLAAERGLDEVLPRIPAYVDRTREIGAMLAALDGLTVVPDPPQTAMLHVLARRPFEALCEATLDLAEATGVWFAGEWRETADPKTQRLELSFGESTFDVPVEEARTLWLELLARSEPT